MGRIRLGFRFAGASWRIVRGEPSLVAFPLLSGAFAIAYTLLVVLPIGVGGFLAIGDANWLGWVLLALLLFGGSIGATFFGVAAAHNAAEAMDGRDPTLGDGLRVARSRLGVIIQWALVSATVGLVLQILADKLGGIGGALVQGLGGLAWGIASFFALPILALEGLGPFDVLRRSAGVVRERWGESLAGNAAIGVVSLIGILLALALIIPGAIVWSDGTAAAGIPLVVIGLGVLFVTLVVSQIVGAVFRVVVFRFATTGAVAPGFDATELEQVFRPRRGGRA
ncbi:MAG: DUF6159 family protein [Gaiellales bacterium]